jgi:hypothetical protein
MARRRPLLDMMRPTLIIRAQAFRKGLLGKNSFWRAIAMVLIGKRILKRLFGSEPEIIEVATLKGGNHWMDIRTYAPDDRRARRRAAN